MATFRLGDIAPDFTQHANAGQRSLVAWVGGMPVRGQGGPVPALQDPARLAPRFPEGCQARKA